MISVSHSQQNRMAPKIVSLMWDYFKAKTRDLAGGIGWREKM